MWFVLVLFYNLIMASILSNLGSYSKLFSGDLAFIVLVFVIFFIYAIYFGKGRVVSLVLSYYPATVLYRSIPFPAKLIFLQGEKLILLNKVGIFLILLISLNIILHKYIFIGGDGGSGSFLASAGFALAVLILVLLFSFTTISLAPIHSFSGSVDVLFADDLRVFLWNLAPIALLALL